MKEALKKLNDALIGLRGVLDTPREMDNYTNGTPIVPKDTYNYSEGMNAGAFTIKKPLESVTADDVLDAYDIENLFANVPIKSETWENLDSEYTRTTNPSKFIWTAAGAKLIYAGLEMMASTDFKTRCKCYEGDYTVNISSNDLKLIRAKLGKSSAKATMRNVGAYNLKVLQDLPANCVGLKLDKVYPLYATGKFSSHTDCFYPKGDFLIDGEDDNGNIAGGFMFRYGGLCTEHSLVLNKVHFLKYGSSYSGVVIYAHNGIDQVQILDSLFDRIGSSSLKTDTREGHGYAGSYISIAFDLNLPIVDGQLLEVNRIKHILVKGNTAYGYEFFTNSVKGSSSSEDVPGRFFASETCRFINNTIYGGTEEDNLFAGYPRIGLEGSSGSLISLGAQNGTRIATRMGFYSCPIWVVGNKFYGAERVIVRRKSSTYNCGMLVEVGQIFIVKNIFENFLCKQCYQSSFYWGDMDKPATSSTEIKAGRKPATYDVYASSTRAWWVNNYLKNIATFSFSHTDIEGVFKGKGVLVPSVESLVWNYKIIRYISSNTVVIDSKWIHEKWEEATIGKYNTDGKDAYYPYGGSDSYYGQSAISSDWKPSKWRIEDLTRDGVVRTADDHEDIQVGVLKDYMLYLWGEKHYDRLFEKYFYDSVAVGFSSILQGNAGSETHYNPLPVYEYTFKNNTFDLGDCCLGGMSGKNHIFCVHFKCEGNKFKARRMSSNRWTAHRNMVEEDGDAYTSRESIFDIVAMDMYKSTYDDVTHTTIKDPQYAPTVTIRNNKFNVSEYIEDDTILPTYVSLVRVSHTYPSNIYKDLGAAQIKTGKVSTDRLKISNNILTSGASTNKVICIQEKYSGNNPNGSTTDIYDGIDGTKSSLTLSEILYPFPSHELEEDE